MTQDLLTREQLAFARANPQMWSVFLTHKLCDMALRFLDTLADNKTPQGWEPIETAPRDGTEIFGGYFKDWEGSFPNTSELLGTMKFEGKKWISSWNGSHVLEYQGDFGSEYKYLDYEPTHWQPLPSPPTLSAKDNNNEQ